MKHALYIIGEPGVGKTTLVETLADGIPTFGGRRPLAHLEYLTLPSVVELGTRRPGGFGGTDALSMSAIVPAEAWVTDGSWPDYALLLAEGDRLACDRFFHALLSGGWNMVIVYLEAAPEVAAERRAARGSTQNEAWIRGRRTKVGRLVTTWESWVVPLDSRQAPAELARKIALVSPVAAALYDEEFVA